MTPQAEIDVAALRASGLTATEVLHQFGFSEYCVSDGRETTLVQRMSETNYRFFPLVGDSQFGRRLHDADLAINKALAAASRTKVRDCVDVAFLDESYLSIAALAWAAAGKSPLSPNRIVENIVRNATSHSRQEYASVRVIRPIDGAVIFDRIQQSAERALMLFERWPIKHYGKLFLDRSGKPTEFDQASFDAGNQVTHEPRKSGVWPIFPDQQENLEGKITEAKPSPPITP
ncbi:MAG TPA: hypothetical protein VNT30_22775 [Stellaceae bacterium]|nr:hypothetical protein [Stellaceae bacterium]